MTRSERETKPVEWGWLELGDAVVITERIGERRRPTEDGESPADATGLHSWT
jgi:hypothetical protein